MSLEAKMYQKGNHNAIKVKMKAKHSLYIKLQLILLLISVNYSFGQNLNRNIKNENVTNSANLSNIVKFDPKNNIELFNEPCCTDFYSKMVLKNNLLFKQKEDKTNQLIYNKVLSNLQNKEVQNRSSKLTYTIPVVVHVIGGYDTTDYNAPELVSDSMIQIQIQHINEAYSNIGYYYQNIGIDVEIQFCLASIDPNNNPTNGITRDTSYLTYLDLNNFQNFTNDSSLKSINFWDSNKYLNIWLVKEISNPPALGYATFPYYHGMQNDGVVMWAIINSGAPGSKTPIHEIGHYLGLYHTFQGGCTNFNCLLDGDFVCDTPPDNSTNVDSVFNNCLVENSCSTDMDDNSGNNPFNVDTTDFSNNYMDYNYQSCRIFFTQGQKERMIASILGVRTSLLISPGCGTTIVPVANFGTSLNLYCGVPTNVQFTDSSLNFPNLWKWDFNNDGMFESNIQNPNYTFNTAGTYIVKLVVANSFGSDTAIRVVSIYNLPDVMINANGTTLTSSEITGNQWYLNGNLIIGDTSQSYTVTQNGDYTVLVTDSNGCSNSSATYTFTTIGITALTTDNGIIIVPNPNDGQFLIGTRNLESEKIRIFNSIGEVIYNSEIKNSDIDLTSHAKGIYFLELITKEKKYIKKLIIQ